MPNATSRRAASPRPKPHGTRRAPLGEGVDLVLAAHASGQRPAPERPCLAVLGRSNVGKSSLLNAILGVEAARVSATPGRTQALYWYRVEDRFDLVDFPGYGWARTARDARERFAGLIEAFLTGEPAPRLALLLVDGRLPPQDSDRSMALFLSRSGVPTVVVATKWDAVKPSVRVRQRRLLAAEYESPDRPLLTVSARTGEALPGLAGLVRERLAPRPRRGAPAPQNVPSEES